MPKIQCKACGKEWSNVQGYMADKGCESGKCPHKRKHPPQNPERPTLSNRSEGEVISYYNENEEAYFTDVPKVIAIELFPPGCRGRKGKNK